MAVRKRNYFNTKSDYSVTYENMRGVDFSSEGENSKRTRFASLVNMYRDYDGDGAEIIESIPGFRLLTTVSGRVHAIYPHRSSAGGYFYVLHAGKSLYTFTVEGLSRGLSPVLKYTVENTKSMAFSDGDYLFIFDGKNIIRVDTGAVFAPVNDSSAASPYVPTLFYNGKELEQRNLLTNKFKESYRVNTEDLAVKGTDGIIYRINPEIPYTCSVVGVSDEVSGEVRIPGRTLIGNEYYNVTEISDRAFYLNKKVTSVYIANGVKKIGRLAFMYCAALAELTLSDSVETVEMYAFAECDSLTYLHLGTALSYMDSTALLGSGAITKLSYALDSQSFALVGNGSAFSEYEFEYMKKPRKISVDVPIFSLAKSIERVTVDGVQHSFTLAIEGGKISGVIVSSTDGKYFDGCDVVIEGTLSDTEFTKSEAGADFLSENKGKIKGFDAILGCTVSEAFDGRIFLSGNKALPNTVFYTQRDITGRNNPLYFGALNYFNDGVGKFPVISMLSSGDALFVFKSASDGEGSIYCHTREKTGIDILPKIYPVSYVHNGISGVGESLSFFDDAVFVSHLGISALEKRQINLERSISARSHNINPKLLLENLSEVHLAKWAGYLVLQAGENIYLADSRKTFTHPTGSREYEWFYLTGIGAYKNDTPVYRYASVGDGPYLLHPNADSVVTDTVYSEAYGNSMEYFVYEGDKKYRVRRTEEMQGGDFYPASAICSPDERLLLFGTEGGQVCIFNNDKRGVAPSELSSDKDFNEEEYLEQMGRRIHPSFYNFAGHAPTYIMRTVNDDGGIPHLTKSTVKGSLVIKLRSFGCGSLTLEVGTDRDGYTEVCKIPDSSLSFSELDFSLLSFKNMEYFTLPTKEKEKRWIDKEITLYSREFNSPIGFYLLSYRFFVKGKIKRR